MERSWLLPLARISRMRRLGQGEARLLLQPGADFAVGVISTSCLLLSSGSQFPATSDSARETARVSDDRPAAAPALRAWAWVPPRQLLVLPWLAAGCVSRLLSPFPRTDCFGCLLPPPASGPPLSVFLVCCVTSLERACGG